MTKFKAGDMVRIITACSGNRVGDIHTLMTKAGYSNDMLWAGHCNCEAFWELINEQAETKGKTYYGYLNYSDYPRPILNTYCLYLEGCGWFHNYEGKDYDNLYKFKGVAKRFKDGMAMMVEGDFRHEQLKAINDMLIKYGAGKFAEDNELIFKGQLLIKKKKTTMQKLHAMLKVLLNSSTKKLIKAGLIDGSLKLTCEGREALDAILFDEHKEELTKAAEEIIKEAEKEK